MLCELSLDFAQHLLRYLTSTQQNAAIVAFVRQKRFDLALDKPLVFLTWLYAAGHKQEYLLSGQPVQCVHDF